VALSLRPPQLGYLTLALLAAASLAYLCYSGGYQQAREQIVGNVQEATGEGARRIDLQLNESVRAISQLAKRLEVDAATSERPLDELVRSTEDTLPATLYLLDAQGNILDESPPGSLARGEVPLHLLRPNPGNPAGFQLLPSRLTPLLQVAHRITRPDGSHLQLGALLPLPEPLVSTTRVHGDQHSFQFLLGPAGELLLHPDHALIGSSVNDLVRPEVRPEFYALHEGLRSLHQGYFWIDADLRAQLTAGLGDGDLLLSYAPVRLPGTVWGLVRVQSLPNLARSAELQGTATALLILSLLGLTLFYRRPTLRPAAPPDALRPLLGRLEEAELRSRQILDHAGDALFYIDPRSGAIIEQNQATLKLLGYSAEELNALPLSDLFPGSERRRYLKLMQRVIKHGYGEETNLQLRCRNGRTFDGAIHARLGRLGESQVVHGVLRDITALKQIETQLRQRNQELSLVNQVAEHASSGGSLQQILDAIRALVIEAFAVDGGGIYLSRHAGTLLELTSHQGLDAATCAELSTLPSGQGLIGRVLGSGRPASSSNLPRDRRLWSRHVVDAGWMSLQVIPLTSREEIVGALFLFTRSNRVFSRDEVRLLLAIGQQIGTAAAGIRLLEEISWQNRLTLASNRELQASRQQLSENLRQQQEVTRTLQRLELMKNQFLALASHELRTPLTYILSGSQLLLEQAADQLGAPHQRILQAVYKGGKRLEEIVENLLEMARLEAQSIYLGKQRIDLPLLLSQLRAPFEATLGKRELRLDIAPAEPVDDLYGDHDHLLKSLHRLIENAIKFTPPGGGIRVSSRRLEDRKILAQKGELSRFNSRFFNKPLAPAYLQLSVSDTGIGIDSDEQTHIFDKFYEIGDIDGHFTSRTSFGGKGVGLGLALVRSMIEAHAGMVWVSSPGTGQGGSSFHLLLPLARTTEAARTGPVPLEA